MNAMNAAAPILLFHANVSPSPTGDAVVFSAPQKHEYYVFKKHNDVIVTDASKTRVMAYFPPRPTQTNTVYGRKRRTKRHDDDDDDDDMVVVSEYRENVMEIQLFYDSRIPGWELATEIGGVGGSELFSNEANQSHCGKTVRQVFCNAFQSSTTETSSKPKTADMLPMLLDLLPREFTFLVQLSLASPTQLFFVDMLAISPTPTKKHESTFIVTSTLSLNIQVSALRHMPFEPRRVCKTIPRKTVASALLPGQPRRVMVRSIATGQCTIMRLPRDFAEDILKEMSPRLRFQYLCLRSSADDASAAAAAEKEYLRLFPKHRAPFRLCRFAFRHWIKQLQQSYYYVHVAKTRTLHQIPQKHVFLVTQLHHNVYRKLRTPITFAVVEDWIYRHCPAEDIFWATTHGPHFPDNLPPNLDDAN
jgi:hypothetical protein